MNLVEGEKSREIIRRSREFMDILTQDVDVLPMVADRGEGVYVWDVDGKKYIDFSSGFAVVSLGHSNPKVIEAIEKQARKLVHFPLADFYHELGASVAEKLSKSCPGGGNKKVVFTNSGAEANEVAIKLARSSTKRGRILAFYGGFHGRTMGSLSLTASKSVQQLGFFPTMPGVIHAPFPNPFRNVWNIDGYEDPEELINRAISFIEDVIFKAYPPEEFAAVFIEPIQGEGGYVVPPRGFFHELFKIARKYGILIMDDEVQMGIGRTGKMWAIENYSVYPDSIQFGKAIANGIPLGGVIHRGDFGFVTLGQHSSTFGGNLIALSVAEVVLEETPKLLPNVERVGMHLGRRLSELMEEFEIIGDSRGIGLARAIEIVKPGKGKTPDPKKRDELLRECFKRGLLLIGCGESSVRIIPPLNVEIATVDRAVDILMEALNTVTE
ncbi:MAG: acetyl ornithine aminotransferase family protein [Fervidicoccaceae archaeon]